MSEKLMMIPSTSDCVEKADKNRTNAATQHGNESNADEENIVVLKLCFSPKRNPNDNEPAVWHEEIQSFIIDDGDVST